MPDTPQSETPLPDTAVSAGEHQRATDVERELRSAFERFRSPVRRINVVLGCTMLPLTIGAIALWFAVAWYAGALACGGVLAVMALAGLVLTRPMKRLARTEVAAIESKHGLTHNDTRELFKSLELPAGQTEYEEFLKVVWGVAAVTDGSTGTTDIVDARDVTDRICPKCKSTKIQLAEDLPRAGLVSTLLNIAGSILFGAIGSLIGNEVGKETRKQLLCKACQHTWREE